MGARKEKIQKLFESLGKGRKNKVLLISTGLEDNYTAKASKVMYDILSQGNGYGIVRNPVSSRYDSRFEFNESHRVFGKCNKGLSIFNNDGTELPRKAMRGFFNRHAGCYALFLWYGRTQGILTDEFIKPRDRIFEVPDLREVKRIIGD